MTEGIRPSFTTTDGVRLNYTDEGSGRPVVLVAGHTAPISSWGLLTTTLLATGHRVVGIDRRHTGASDFPDHGRRMARQGTDLHELLTFLGLDHPVVVASSMGCSATWAMIDLFGASGLGGLVLVDQTPKMVNEADWNLGMYDLTWDTLSELVEVFGSPEAETLPRFRRGERVPPAAAMMPILLELLATPYDHSQARPLLRDHAVQDWRDVLPRIDVPTLAIGGRRSEIWPVEHAEYIAKSIPGADLLVCENSGHAPMWSEPDLFNAEVERFIAHV